MHRALALLVCVAGCGRVNFAPRDEAGDAAGIDAAAAICHSGTWSAPVPVASINSASHESDPTFTSDGRFLFYTSNAPPSAGYAIWQASRGSVNDSFGNAQYIVDLDSPGDEQDPVVSPDGLTIYFQSDFNGTLAIYTTTRSSVLGLFDQPVTAVALVGDPSPSKGSPEISADGLELYYASGLGIGYATRATTADEFAYVRSIAEVDSPQTDTTPSVSADGLEMFFESYRTGTGAMFRSTRATTQDLWSAPVEVDLISLVPGATSAGGPALSPDGRTLYFYANPTTIDLYMSTRSCD